MERFIRNVMLLISLMCSITTTQASERKYIIPFNYDADIYASYYPDVTTSPCGDIFTVYPGHEGIDYIMSEGTPIYAAASGMVTRQTESCSGTLCYGSYLYIDHGSNNWTVYAHLSSYVASSGQYVNQGDLIAYSGVTGTSTPHLHWEVITGSSAVGGNPHNPYYCNNEWFTTSPPTFANQLASSIPNAAQQAIEAKADELWAIGRTSSTPGLIAYEPEGGDMHWYSGVDNPYIIEDWEGGQWGWVAITYTLIQQLNF